LNCAVSGWGLYEYRADLLNRGLKFKPDMVLVGFCLNDVRSHIAVRTFLADKKTKNALLYSVSNAQTPSAPATLLINPFLFRYSYIYRALFSLKMRFTNRPPGPPDTPLKILTDMKNAANGRLYGVVFPYLKPLRDYDEEELREYTDTKTALEKTGIEYLDLTEYFNGYGSKISGFRARANDKIHYNEEANALKAGLIYDWLKNKLK
jgi:lysophospholipase L1-like esterase